MEKIGFPSPTTIGVALVLISGVALIAAGIFGQVEAAHLHHSLMGRIDLDTMISGIGGVVGGCLFLTYGLYRSSETN